MTDQPPRPDEAAPTVVARPVEYAHTAPQRSAMEISHVRRRDALLDLTLVVLAALVVPYVPGVFATLAPGELELADVGLMVIVQKWCEAGLALGLLLYFVLRHRLRAAAFGLRGDQVGQQTLWGLGTLICMYGAFFAGSVVVFAILALTSGFEEEFGKRVEFAESLPVESLASTLILLAAVAVHEEILFRGLLLPYLRRVLGSWWSAGLVSALLFAGLHVPEQGLLASGIQILSIAVVLTVFFILSRSLLAVTLAHLLFDFVQFQLVRLLPDLEELLENFPA